MTRLGIPYKSPQDSTSPFIEGLGCGNYVNGAEILHGVLSLGLHLYPPLVVF